MFSFSCRTTTCEEALLSAPPVSYTTRFVEVAVVARIEVNRICNKNSSCVNTRYFDWTEATWSICLFKIRNWPQTCRPIRISLVMEFSKKEYCTLTSLSLIVISETYTKLNTTAAVHNYFEQYLVTRILSEKYPCTNPHENSSNHFFDQLTPYLASY